MVDPSAGPYSHRLWAETIVAEATQASAQRIGEVVEAADELHRLADSLAASRTRAQQVLGGPTS